MRKYKYPRTPHFSFSEGCTSDDKMLEDDGIFEGKEVVVSIKMDGENTTIYNDGTFHARSIDSLHMDYHSWLAAFVPTFAYKLPDNIRMCSEYLYAKHSIAYDDLPSYLLCFSLWENEKCLSWNDTLQICKEVGVETVPVLYKGLFDLNLIKHLANSAVQSGQEGIVVRLADSFQMKDFSKSVAKYVRKNHVQTDGHWAHRKIDKNKLRK